MLAKKKLKKEPIALLTQWSKNKISILLIASILVAIVFDFIFIHNNGNQLGIGVFIFQALFLSLIFFAFPNGKKGIIFRIALGFCAIQSLRYAIFNNATIGFLNFFVLVFLDLFLLAYYTGFSEHIRNKLASLKHYIRLPIAIISALPKAFDSLGDQLSHGKHKLFSKHIVNVLVSIAILIALLLVIIPLLSSADLVFKEVLDKYLLNYLSSIQDINIGTTTIRIIVIALISLFVRNILVGLNIIKKANKTSTMPRTVNTMRSNIILIGLNVIYIVFCVIQFKYLFFGDHQLIIDLGLKSYAEYIHRGFYELVAVAGLNYLLYCVFFSRKTEKFKLSTRTVSLFLLLLVTLLMMISAYTRINMYVQAYGQTELRIFVFFIIYVIAVVYLLLIYKLYKPKPHLFAPITLIILFAFTIISYWNIDKYIANYNIKHNLYFTEEYNEDGYDNDRRFKKSKVLDTTYLIKDLSHDALSQQLSLIKRNNDPLINVLKNKYKKIQEKSIPWYHFNYHTCKLHNTDIE